MSPGRVSDYILTTKLDCLYCCNTNRDLDVVIRLPSVDDQTEKKRVLFQLSAALKASGITRDVQVNHFARVPVVTFQTVPNFGESLSSCDAQCFGLITCKMLQGH